MSNIFDSMVPDRDNVPSRESDEPTAPAEDLVQDHITASHTSHTSADVKQVVQELLKTGFIEEAKKPDSFRHTITHERNIQTALEPLDLQVRLDSHRGVAFLIVAPNAEAEANADGQGEEADSWAHPLVRRQRLTLEQSLLVAILRQAFVMHEQEAGVGNSAARMSVDELLPQFQTYFGDSGSDAKNESRLMIQLDHLKGYGIVSEVDKNHEVTIRPLIAHLANPESLIALLDQLSATTEENDDA